MTQPVSLMVALADMVETQADAIEDFWNALLDEENPEGPHRQRTAINKLGTVSRIAETIGAAAEIDKPLKVLRKWQKRLGSARDIDVMRALVERVQSESTRKIEDAANHLLSGMRMERRAQMNELLPLFLGREGKRVGEAIDALRTWASKRRGAHKNSRGEDVEVMTAALMKPLVSAWVGRRDDAASRMDANHLHEFRLANKRLRDVTEVIAEKVDARWIPLRDLARIIHKSLGDLNDLNVLAGYVATERAALAVAGGRPARIVRQYARMAGEIERLREIEFANLLGIWPGIIGLDLEAQSAAASEPTS